MKACSIALIVLLASMVAGCDHKAKPEPQKIVVRYVEAEAVRAANMQSRSEYIAPVRGDVETELGFKVGGVLELIARKTETEDEVWTRG